MNFTRVARKEGKKEACTFAKSDQAGTIGQTRTIGQTGTVQTGTIGHTGMIGQTGTVQTGLKIDFWN